MKHSTTFITVITLGAWVLSRYFMPTVHTDFPLINYLFRVAFPLATLSLALLLIHRHTNLAAVWGLAADHRLAFRKAFLFCLPMLIGYGVMANLNIHASWRAVAWTIILAPVLEELVFRGFLFGQLFRFAGWGFIPAGLINALVFGALHLYQASDLWSAIGIFSVTAMGGMWFAWLYIEWDRNLWVPLFMHMLMNAYGRSSLPGQMPQEDGGQSLQRPDHRHFGHRDHSSQQDQWRPTHHPEKPLEESCRTNGDIPAYGIIHAIVSSRLKS
ncbi:MAG: CPBP family intramembrane glutamic endopeptidase [Saprospiraceae bacterium]